MSTTRTSLIERLKIAFKNAETKKRGIASCKNANDPAVVVRAFDELPDLLSQQDTEILSDEFVSILTRINKIKETDKGFDLVLHKDKLAVKNWVQKMTALGCTELIDANGKIKNELVELLEWNEYKNIINPCDLICAYVGAVNQQIMSMSNNLIQQHKNAYAGLCGYLGHYREWVVEVMKHPAYRIDPTHLLTKPTHTRGIDSTDLAIGLGALGLFAIAAIAGFAGVILVTQVNGGNTPRFPRPG